MGATGDPSMFRPGRDEVKPGGTPNVLARVLSLTRVRDPHRRADRGSVPPVAPRRHCKVASTPRISSPETSGRHAMTAPQPGLAARLGPTGIAAVVTGVLILFGLGAMIIPALTD